MALTTLANVKAWLEILPATTTNDVLLTRLIDAASAYIESWLNRKMNSASYAEIRNGNGKNYITVGNYPIISVQSVLIGGVTQTILSQSDYVNVGVKF